MIIGIGIDIGGTKTEVACINCESLEVLARKRFNTHRENENDEDFFQNLCSLLDEFEEKFPGSTQRISVGLPGAVTPTPQSAILTKSSVPFLAQKDLKELFISRLETKTRTVASHAKKIRIAFENDANLFTLVESRLGAGKKFLESLPHGSQLENLILVGITLGTGVGGGIFVNGKIIRGRRGAAGEVGHLTLYPNGEPCYCGNSGCAETYLSGTAFEKRLGPGQAQEIFKILNANDNPSIWAHFERYKEDLISFLSTLSNTLDPDAFILGGGLSTQPLLYDGLKERLGDQSFLTEDPPAILQSVYGDSAAIFGVALME